MFIWLKIAYPELAMFASTNAGSTILTSASILAVGVLTVWDNRSDREHALNTLKTKIGEVGMGPETKIGEACMRLEAEIGEVSMGLKAKIGEVDRKVNAFDHQLPGVRAGHAEGARRRQDGFAQTCVHI